MIARRRVKTRPCQLTTKSTAAEPELVAVNPKLNVVQLELWTSGKPTDGSAIPNVSGLSRNATELPAVSGLPFISETFNTKSILDPTATVFEAGLRLMTYIESGGPENNSLRLSLIETPPAPTVDATT